MMRENPMGHYKMIFQSEGTSSVQNFTDATVNILLFKTEKKLKDTSNVKSVIVERKGAIEHFLHFLLKQIQ